MALWEQPNKEVFGGERKCVSASGLSVYSFVAVFDDGSIWHYKCLQGPFGTGSWDRVHAPGRS